MVVNALEQRDGVEVLTAPKIITHSGRQAHIEVSDLQTVVTGVGQGGQSGGGGGGAQTGGVGGGATGAGGFAGFTYTTTPFPFGPVLDVIPYVSADDNTIEMTLIPSITEFIGYDNPGDFVPSLQVFSGGAVGISSKATLPLPRIRVRQVVTSVSVWDAQTVVLGGLISEDVKKTRDKVPVLGDIPVLGRLFRSEATSTTKKNLVIFVTPTILDPAGRRVHDPNNLPFDPEAAAKQGGSMK
jgi:general secretion pathway protein D